MSEAKISDPAPNWCRTCGRRPNDPMAALCLDTHHRTMERLHPQPAELAEQQGVWNDSARLACLESWAREPGGLLLHAESETGRRGLGLGKNCGNRTLAQAIDGCATHAEKDSFAALAATGKQQVGEVQEPVSKKAVRQFIADRATNDEHREDILSGDYDHTAWFDHIRELMEALAARQPVAHQQPSFGKVQEIRIPARNKLDPISVFVQDQAWGRGRIVVTCYGNAWQGFWGAMGDRTVMQFVAQCDADYVAGNMISGRQTLMTKAERAYTQRIAAEVITEFRALIGGQRDAAPGVGNG